MGVWTIKKRRIGFLVVIILLNLLFIINVQAQTRNLYYILDEQNKVILVTQQKISQGDRYWTGETWYEIKKVTGNIGYAVLIEDPNLTSQRIKSKLPYLFLFLILLITGSYLYLKRKKTYPKR